MRDWGHTFDYVKAYWMMLNKLDEPKDYVISTQQSITIKEWAELSFREAGFNNIEWIGEGVNEKLLNKNDKKVLLEVDKEFYRPSEVPYLRGSYQKAKKDFGWEPKILWQGMLKEMVEYDDRLARREKDALEREKTRAKL